MQATQRLGRQINLLRKNGIKNARKVAVSENGKLLLTAYLALESLERIQSKLERGV